MDDVPEKIKSRSEEFENLVLDHTDMMYAVALRLTNNHADAEDLLQNSVVKALRFHHKFEEGTYIKAWLLTILRNTFINEYRRKTRQPLNVELNDTEAAPSKSPDPDIAVNLDRESKDILLELLDDNVKTALMNLPDEFRIAVIYADLEDMSYKDIAEKLNCPLGTVMSRLYRGRKMLREVLSEYALSEGIIKSDNDI